MLLLLATLAAAAEPAPTVFPAPSTFSGEYPAPLITAARKYRGRPYKWAGRAESLDCMGLVFLAWTDVTGQDWESLSVNPTELVAARSLGAPVPGLDGVLTEQIDWSLFRSGDVVFFLSRIPNPAEPALVTLDGEPHWVRHMALYEGDLLRRFIAGEHTKGKVSELPLPGYLDVWRVMYQGIFVVRPGT
ncbi:MAG: hypothetical protein V4850_34490 [Myxococcota bacterium]